VYVEVRDHRALQLHAGRQQFGKLFILLAAQPEVVDGSAQLLPNPVERRDKLFGSLEWLRLSGGRPQALCLNQGTTEVLEGLVVQVAGYAAPLVLPDLLQTLLCPLAVADVARHLGEAT
jgi:hypothetical protein